MKILLISQNFYPELGSAANRAYVIFKLLNKFNNQLNILTTPPSYPTKALFKKKLYYDDNYINNLESKQIYRLKVNRQKQGSSFFNRILYFIEEFIHLRIFLKKQTHFYDYIYVSSPNIFIAWATLFFKNNSVKYILEIRDLWPDSVNDIKGINIKFVMPILKFLEKKMYNAADFIIVNNLSFQKHIKNKLNSDKPMFYLPNGVQDAEINSIKKYKNFTAIYTGNIGHAQDVDKLIQIAKKLNEKQIYLIAIVYGAKAVQFRDSVKDLEYIQIKKPMPRKQCLIEISKAHISISLLKSSNVFLNVLPGKIIDAISMGTIPVTNLGGFTKKIINDNNLGIAIYDANIEALLEKIQKLKVLTEKQREMQNNCINYRNENLIWENNIKELQKFLMESDKFE
ncbi:glycosyltransferase family 4 protein [Staphylococcus saprophyticus]|uniref:glycosyltransferase family 4 protein n=1 Tax=Staphylococcus TaxID=1279 RepID=UPI001980CF2E|nr:MULTISPECIES: glycosyltransferase family 4 protein [Staphylococcus]MDW3865720.1 glycosyltransferase family 4 protein [Staphylococcus saprophyticus]MDW4191203.1 glycosyltransferase family 4 protein [Staphylococcus saprophyticus]MEB5700748.1 glycosyltransferase family 4 protein [Staphylococcus saprophyticus]